MTIEQDERAAWRDHPAALDAKALATAQEIALMWGRDRSQFVSRIQVAVRDAMDWVHAASNSANVAQGAEHPDDVAVDRFAAAMKEKLAAARAKGRGGWQQCDPTELSIMLREHVEKGDPRDVANFCMFLWSLGQPISDAALPMGRRAAAPPAQTARSLTMRAMLCGGAGSPKTTAR